MPVVRRYQAGQIRQTPTPDVRQNAVDTPESLGIDLDRAQAQRGRAYQQVGGALRGLGGVFYREALIQQQRDEDFEVLGGDNQLATLQDSLQASVQQTVGKGAKGSADTALAQFDERAGKIEASLTSENAKARFAKKRFQQRGQIERGARLHELDQTRQYEAGEFNAKLARIPQSAAQAVDGTDGWAGRVAETLRDGEDTIVTFGRHVGDGPEEQAQRIEQLRNNTHISVLGRLIDRGDVKTARVYFEETQSQINTEAQGKIEKALTVSSVRGDSQRAADAIFETVTEKTTLTSLLAQAKDITDPEVRDATESRLKEQWNVREAQETDDRKQLIVEIGNLLDKTGTVASIPPTQWSSLTTDQKENFKDYVKRKTKAPIETDLTVYLGLMRQAMDTETQAAFSRLNLADPQYLSSIGSTDLKHLAEVQKSIVTGNVKQRVSLTASESQQDEIASHALLGLGMNPNPAAIKNNQPLKDQVLAFWRAERAAVAAKEAETGKDITGSEIQEIVDTLLITGQKKGPKGIPLYVFEERAAESGGDVALPRAEAPPMPPGLRVQAEDSLRRAGRPVTEEAIQGLYRALLARGNR